MTKTFEFPNGKLRVSDTDFEGMATIAIMERNAVMKIASFNNEECMRLFLKVLEGAKE